MEREPTSARFATLEIERRGPGIWLWMNRPEVHNAFDETSIAELTEAVRSFAGDPAARAIVIAGRGRSFSAGADLQWMRRQSVASPEANLEDARRMAALFRTIDTSPKPTIARVHGAALGGGLGIAAACGICIASADASFATTEVRFGILPAVIGPYVIRAIGARQATRWFQTAERFDAERARELGLAHEAVPAEALDDTVQKIVNALAAGGPLAQMAARDLICAVAVKPIDDALIEETAGRIARQRAGAEAKEGFEAFFEKRAPDWSSGA